MAAPGEAQAVISQSGHRGLVFNNTDDSSFTATFQFISHTAAVVEEGQSKAIQPFQIALVSLITEAFPEVNMFTHTNSWTMTQSSPSSLVSFQLTYPGLTPCQDLTHQTKALEETMDPWKGLSSELTRCLGPHQSQELTTSEPLLTCQEPSKRLCSPPSEPKLSTPTKDLQWWQDRQQYPIITVPQRIRLHNANPQYTAPSTNDQGQIRSHHVKCTSSHLPHHQSNEMGCQNP